MGQFQFAKGQVVRLGKRLEHCDALVLFTEQVAVPVQRICQRIVLAGQYCFFALELLDFLAIFLFQGFKATAWHAALQAQATIDTPLSVLERQPGPQAAVGPHHTQTLLLKGGPVHTIA
ncbi:hypothetical protein D3C79_755610 [compost metagenome]